MVDVHTVLADLDAESAELDDLVTGLAEEQWTWSTPAVGWTIAHQIAHLTWTDEVSVQAITDAEAFAAVLERAAADPEHFVDAAATERVDQPVGDLLRSWRAGRTRLHDALRQVPPGEKITWFGPPMGAAFMATARLMETWAHGLDVADTVGVVKPPTARIRNVAHLGVRTRDFAYAVNQEPAPDEEFRVELTGPDGTVWTWGPTEAAQWVTGTADDFCRLVTQRRHRADTELVAVGAEADRWLDIAQAFAGPPGGGREPSAGAQTT